MTRLRWDQVGERTYETGVDHGVLYLPNGQGVYDQGYAWNGLTAVTESPSGAESNKQYADNIEYLNLVSAEQFGGTIEAFTYPNEFGQCDGSVSPVAGVRIGQQTRKSFGLSYRTLLGNDVEGNDYGYKLHLVYGGLVAPSERAYTTVNDTPEPLNFSWEFSTTPVEVPGFRPSATLTITSTEVPSAGLAALETILYGTEGTDPRLPSPSEVFALLDGTFTTTVAPPQPAYNSTTDTITIPTVTGVVYEIDGEVVAAGPVVITKDTIVHARPAEGYVFPDPSDDDFFYDFT